MKNDIMTYNCAVDGGNSSIKVVVEGEYYKSYPNIYAYNKIPYAIEKMKTTSTPKAMGYDRLDITVTPHCDKNTESKTYLFGALAEDYTRENRQPVDKATDEQLLSNILVSIAYTFIRYKLSAGEKLSKHVSITTNVSTGLPYHENNIKGNAKKFKENLEGPHRIEFNNPYFVNVLGIESMELSIPYALINIEGVAALDLIVQDADSDIGKMEATDLLGKVVSMIDIGASTTEEIGIKFVPKIDAESLYDTSQELEVEAAMLGELCEGIENGVGYIMDNAIVEIESKYPVRKLVRRDIELAYTKLGFRDKKFGHLVEYGIYIGDIFDKYAKPFAEMLARSYDGSISKANLKENLLKLYIGGGGSYFNTIKDKFIEELSNRGYDNEKITTSKDPIYANVMSYFIALMQEINNEEAAAGAEE